MTSLERHVWCNLLSIIGRYPPKWEIAAEDDGNYHIFFQLEEALSLEILNQIAKQFQTISIDLESGHQEESDCNDGCCYERGRSWISVNIYGAVLNLPTDV